MTYRVLFVGEGSSDEGITVHIERIAIESGLSLAITAPNSGLLPTPDRSVRGKLKAILELGAGYDLFVIHRDADGAGRQSRVDEIVSAIRDVTPTTPYVPVIPVRMTEAWLVLEERLIRVVAGNPNGRTALEIPDPARAERIADPKALLKELLVNASGLTGRKRRMFQARFPFHRRQVLERLDPRGPVTRLRSWQDFDVDLRDALSALRKRRPL